MVRDNNRALIQMFITPNNNIIYAVINKDGAVKFYSSLEELNLVKHRIINYALYNNGIAIPFDSWVDSSIITQQLQLTDKDPGTKYFTSDAKAYKKYFKNWLESFMHSSIVNYALDQLG